MKWSLFKLLKNRSNTYKLYLRAFIIAFPMIIVFGMAEFFVSHSIVKSTAVDICNDRLGNFAQTMDEYFKNVSVISSDMRFIGAGEYRDRAVPNAWDYKELVESAKNFSDKNSGMSVIFYTPGSNKISCEFGTYDAQKYFDRVLSSDDKENGFTLKDFKECSERKIYKQSRYNHSNDYIVCLMDSSLLHNARVALLIDTDVFNSIYGDNFAIFDDDGKNVYAGNELIRQADIRFDTDKLNSVRIDTTSYVYLVRRSAIYNWNYVAFIPKSQFNYRMVLLLYLFCAFIVLFSLIWLVYSLVMTNKIYKPIRDFKTKVVEVPQFDSARDDFDDIYRIIKETGTNHSELRKMHKLLLDKYHVALLKNMMDISDREGYDSAFLEGILLKNYVVIDCFISCAGNTSETKNRHVQEVEQSLCDFIADTYDGMADVAMNIEAGCNERVLIITLSDGNFSVVDFVRQIKRFVKKEIMYPFFAKIVISNMYETEGDIEKAYKSVRQTADCLSVEVANEVLCETDKNDFIDEVGAELISRKFEELRKDKFRKIKNVFDDVLKIASDQKMPRHYIRRQFFTVFEKLASDIGLFESQFADECFTIREKILYANTVDDFDDIAQSVSAIQSEYKVSGANSSNNDKIIEEIKLYVNENYSDHNLSLTLLADIYDRSPVYLSRLFKQKTGIKFTDYVKQIRLREAENLLLEKSNEYTVSMIADMVGYTDVNHFIKTFKAEFGKTPGQIKNTNKDM